MKYAATDFVLDTPIFGAGGLVLMGVSVEWWIAGLAILYGVIRLSFVITEFYWKWKDRHEQRKTKAECRNDGGDGKSSPSTRNGVSQRGEGRSQGNPSEDR